MEKIYNHIYSIASASVLSMALLAPAQASEDLGLATDFGVIILGDYIGVDANTSQPFHSSTLINGDLVSKNSLGGNLHTTDAATQYVLVAGGNVEVLTNTIQLNRGKLWAGGASVKMLSSGLINPSYLINGGPDFNICGRTYPSLASCTNNTYSTPPGNSLVYNVGDLVLYNNDEYKCIATPELLVDGTYRWCNNNSATYLPDSASSSSIWEKTLSNCSSLVNTCYNTTMPSFMTCYEIATKQEVTEQSCLDDDDRSHFKYQIKNSEKSKLIDLPNVLNNPTDYPATATVDPDGNRITFNKNFNNLDTQVVYVTEEEFLQKDWILDTNGLPDLSNTSIVFNVIDDGDGIITNTESNTLSDRWEPDGANEGVGLQSFHNSTPTDTADGQVSPKFFSRVIFNFPGLNSYEGRGTWGMLLAPTASVKLTGGNQNGPLIVSKLEGKATATSGGFAGLVNSNSACLTPFTVSFDAPSATSSNSSSATFADLDDGFGTSSMKKTIRIVPSDLTRSYDYEFVSNTASKWYTNFDNLLKNIPISDSSAPAVVSVGSLGDLSITPKYLGQYSLNVKVTDKNDASCVVNSTVTVSFISKYQFH